MSQSEYSHRKRVPKRENFLQQMNQIIPWKRWVAMISPFYPEGKRGRPPKEIECMLRMYLMQAWFNLSDEGIEDAIYDSYSMKKFLGIDFRKQQVPDATTLLKFRHLLEEHDIGRQIFDDIRERLQAVGLMMQGGSIVDATIIQAPSSTKNASKTRDPEMHQTKKGNQWYHGMKIHSGVDAGSGYIHTITATAANVHDICEAHKLLRKDDHVLYADSGYLGIEKREEIRQDSHLASMEYRIVNRPSRHRITDAYQGIDYDRLEDSRKSSIRCKVEHPFLIVKKHFGYMKTVYRGIKKNLHRCHILFASANLLMCIRAGQQEEFCYG